MNISDIELSILASVSNGYTAGQMLEAIHPVITAKREEQYRQNSCTADEFIPTIGLQTPVLVDEENRIKV